MISERLARIFDSLRNVAPWPPVASKVLELSQRE